ncbi:trypsin-like serine protease [Staphylococcus sp. SQ8-PEA]|uniref:Serine protease n=1 Tax=Staphylococcus marylandisciuri TaxID=2981529 RepID=A0ABT2QNB9_9STAP|nr:trypsin-like serine protease [Staphylococcus marylandisciuri]MCU5745472.1 trypsin-like serine protease [Staphylococcus marylandisciuri]
MNRKFTNLRKGVVTLPIIVAGVYFFSQPSSAHASETTSVTPQKELVSNQVEKDQNTNTGTSLSTNQSSDKDLNKSSSYKSQKEDTLAHTESTDKAVEVSGQTDSSVQVTNQTERSTQQKSLSNSPGYTGFRAYGYNEEDSVDYDTSKDPNYDEDGVLIDTRRKLENYEAYNNTVYVYVENDKYKGSIENLKHGEATGALIGKNYILTAAHVIYNNNYPRDYMTGGYVVPGKHAGNEQFGQFKIKNLYVPDKYKESPLLKYDIGIIEVDPSTDEEVSITRIPPNKIKAFSDDMIGKEVYSRGYPLDKNVDSIDQYGVSGTIIQRQKNGNIEYSMYGHSGQSGSPVFLEDTGEIIAVHSYGMRGNKYGTLGTPITPELYDWIMSIINKPTETTEEPSKPVKPAQPVEPTEPEEPAQPVEPTEPEEPAQPVEPTEPEEPAQPVEPTEPEEPAQPVEPTEPEEPTQPVEPTEPKEPAQPVEPTEPEEPAQPVEPTEPEEPAQPVEPTEPEKPTQPVEPTEPEEPTQPGQPTGTDEPAQPIGTIISSPVKPSQSTTALPASIDSSKVIQTHTPAVIVDKDCKPIHNETLGKSSSSLNGKGSIQNEKNSLVNSQNSNKANHVQPSVEQTTVELQQPSLKNVRAQEARTALTSSASEITKPNTSEKLPETGHEKNMSPGIFATFAALLGSLLFLRKRKQEK